MTEAELGGLWEAGQRAERTGDYTTARAAYGQIVAELVSSERPVRDYLLERLGHVLVRVGDYRTAVTFLGASLAQRRQARDVHGAFRVQLTLAQACITAVDLESARRFLTDALGNVSPDDSEAVAARVEALRWSTGNERDRALTCVEALKTLARFWAADGQFAAAMLALRRVLASTDGTGGFVSRPDVALLLAELLADCGRVDEARALSTDYCTEDGSAGTRWRIFRARCACLSGDLSMGRRELAAVRERERTTLAAVQASHALVQLLILLNRVAEAERVIGDTMKDLHGDATGRAWRARFESLATTAALRRTAAVSEIVLPLVPEQLWDLESSEEASPNVNGPEAAPPEAPATRQRERFADECARRANLMLRSLAAGRREDAAVALRSLAQLTAATDSSQLRVRTRYYEALFAYYAGAYGDARDDIEACLAHADAQGLCLDEWQYARLSAWTYAQLGDLPAYEREAIRAKELLDGLSSRMDEDDRVFFSLNKLTVRDEYLAARVRSLGMLRRSRFPIFAVKRWLDRRALRRASATVYEEATCLVGWDVERGLHPDASPRQVVTPETAAGTHEVEAWVATQLALLRRAERSRWRLPWPRASRVPATVCLLHYYVLADRLFCFRVSARDVCVFTLPATRVQLDETVKHILGEAKRQQDLDVADGRLDKQLAALSALLQLPAVMDGLDSRVQRLVVVPHDVLVHVPFAALPLADGRVCDRFGLSMVPSARDVEVGVPDGSHSPGRFLGVGVTEYPASDLPRLDRAVAEIREAAACMPRDTPVCLLPDELARRDAVLDALPDAEWTHLACHGEFNRHAPHLSALMLTDGKLTLAELQQCRLRMRLAVLASCWSSTAAVLPGNEMVCLPGAFLRAGARAVLASLWELDDKTNFRFMRDYYPAALRDGPVDGLAAVQRAWARSPEREKRMALRWAAYTVYGS